MDIKAVVGRNVKRPRAAKGLSQERPAFGADLHRTYVTGVEHGIRNPTELIVSRLADPPDVATAKFMEERG